MVGPRWHDRALRVLTQTLRHCLPGFQFTQKCIRNRPTSVPPQALYLHSTLLSMSSANTLSPLWLEPDVLEPRASATVS